MVRPRSFPGELLAGGVGEIVGLGDAHFLVLPPPDERGEVRAGSDVGGRGGREGGRGRRSSGGSGGGCGGRRKIGHGAKVREGRVDVLMSSMQTGRKVTRSLYAVTQAALPFPAVARCPNHGRVDRGAVSQG